MEYAKDCNNLSEFKKRYHIYDYGKNHFAYAENNYKRVYFPYDDFIFGLTDNSYKIIKDAFQSYLDSNIKVTRI